MIQWCNILGLLRFLVCVKKKKEKDDLNNFNIISQHDNKLSTITELNKHLFTFYCQHSASTVTPTDLVVLLEKSDVVYRCWGCVITLYMKGFIPVLPAVWSKILFLL